MKQKTDLSNYKNPEHDPGRGVILRFLWLVANVIFLKNPLSLSSTLKTRILRLFGAKIGNKVVIKPSVSIKYPWFLNIDDFSWIGEEVWIDNLCSVKIGKNVCISQGALLLTGNHNYKSTGFDLITGEIILEDGVWIGAKAIVCAGVTCKSHAILTVNSVATTNLEAYQIYQGNPAVIIRERKFNEL